MGFVEDFFNTLQTYNETVLPVTVITLLLAIIVIYLVAKKSKQSSRIISSILSFLWVWSAIVFFIAFFGSVEAEFLGFKLPGAWYLGGILFIVQSILLVVFGVTWSSLSFGIAGRMQSTVGALMVIYAIIIYPIIGFLTGLGYPRYPIFGTAPCPLTIFTLGLLQWTDRKMPSAVAIIPFVWALMGLMPVVELKVWADVGLMLSGIVGFPLILYYNTKLGN